MKETAAVRYEKNYSEKSFWSKLVSAARKAGVKLIYTGLLLYYTLQREATPKWAKTVIISALGYFIFPADAIPDFIPMTGYADDLYILSAALGTCSLYINKEVKKNAKEKINDFFDENVVNESVEVDSKLS